MTAQEISHLIRLLSSGRSGDQHIALSILQGRLRRQRLTALARQGKFPTIKQAPLV